MVLSWWCALLLPLLSLWACSLQSIFLFTTIDNKWIGLPIDWFQDLKSSGWLFWCYHITCLLLYCWSLVEKATWIEKLLDTSRITVRNIFHTGISSFCSLAMRGIVLLKSKNSYWSLLYITNWDPARCDQLSWIDGGFPSYCKQSKRYDVQLTNHRLLLHVWRCLGPD
jgi:hypothetical protein